MGVGWTFEELVLLLVLLPWVKELAGISIEAIILFFSSNTTSFTSDSPE
jgi:hypothetical protein